ncbi:Cytochrome c oxidase assembly protein cox15 [Tulasnella sp. JGI-2019a]|nr:Cytochrome c oxidase assembly protein cox15 [Tulasnella sp. JGI-2019a]KAG9014206.1 Cytochrome c oxidase assembly protein cox15 [Tulasnella sp. JGI-2019a]
MINLAASTSFFALRPTSSLLSLSAVPSRSFTSRPRVFSYLRSGCHPENLASRRSLSWLVSRQSTASAAASVRRHPFFLPNPFRSKIIHPAFFSSTTSLTSPSLSIPANDASSAAESNNTTDALPTLSTPAVSNWLLGCSALVFGIIVVGGVTRLTESGLSITEWKPFTGAIPPLTLVDWTLEFEKYKATPEFKLLNHRITLDEFKSIFYMEWGHRVLGRLIGVVYVLPFAYLLSTRRLTRSLTLPLTGFSFLLGFQGFLGWYMVKSGLEESLMDTPSAVPRVSQYRLAAHLGAALALYCGMLGTAFAVRSDWRWANGGTEKHIAALNEFLKTGGGRRFKAGVIGLLGLVFLTALSGAFVAGLDAGLVYNEFPMMGNHLVPPTDELFSPFYAKKADGSDLWWRNILENPTTVQFDHRCLAITTYISTTALFLTTRFSPVIRASLPALTRTAVTAAFHTVNLQLALGISTLLYLVPTPLAAMHQAGSVLLLSCFVGILSTLRRPGMAAQAWRRASVARTTGGPVVGKKAL